MAGKYFDLQPVYMLFGCCWLLWCMFGGMLFDENTPSWLIMFYIISVIVTLAITPTIERILK
jgi:hypothetical protein